MEVREIHSFREVLPEKAMGRRVRREAKGESIV